MLEGWFKGYRILTMFFRPSGIILTWLYMASISDLRIKTPDTLRESLKTVIDLYKRTKMAANLWITWIGLMVKVEMNSLEMDSLMRDADLACKAILVLLPEETQELLEVAPVLTEDDTTFCNTGTPNCT